MQLKTAFYPCCGNDIQEPIKILREYVNRIIFCDINQNIIARRQRAKSLKYNSSLELIFVCEDARKALSNIGRVDILFHRKDGIGEGGSGIFILGKKFLSLLLIRMPSEGGMIITDGSCNRDHMLGKILRDTGCSLNGWRLHLRPEQLLMRDYNLMQILVNPISNK